MYLLLIAYQLLIYRTTKLNNSRMRGHPPYPCWPPGLHLPAGNGTYGPVQLNSPIFDEAGRVQFASKLFWIYFKSVIKSGDHASRGKFILIYFITGFLNFILLKFHNFSLSFNFIICFCFSFLGFNFFFLMVKVIPWF